MALAPADFYAYSRATGVPVPETPEERAALAPAVLEFRRSQTQAPKQESNIPGILGAVAGVGALAGLGALAARRFGAKGAVAAPPLTREGTQSVQNLGMIGRQAANEAVVREARQQRPQGVVQTDLSVINNLLQDKSLLAAVEAQEAVESLTPQGLKEFRGAESRARNEYRSAITQIGDEIIAQERASAQLPVISQALGALESGEDQMTGRVLRGVQRNEDLDASQVNQVARQTGNAEVAASLTPDGIPKDQIEIKVPERIYMQPGEGIQKRAALVKSWQTPSEVTLIGRYPAISEAVTEVSRGTFPGGLGESTGESVIFTPVDPYQGRTNVTRGGVEFTVQEGRLQGVPVRTTIEPRGTALEGLRGPTRPTVEAMSPEDAAAKLAEFEISREAQIQNAMARGLSEARARRNVQLSESQKAALESTMPSYSPEDVMSQPGLTAYGDVSEAERFSEEMSSKSGRLQALEQGGFLEEQIDPGQLRTEPRQVSPGVMIRPSSRTSYRGMTGRPGVGIYGEQAPGRPGEPGFGSGAVEAKKEIKVEGEDRGVTTPRPFIQGVDLPEYRTPEGFVYTEEALTQPTKAKGGYKGYGTQPPSRPENRIDALLASEEITRLQREGKTTEAQAFLDKMMEERGISNLGISQPLRPRINRQGRF